MEYNYNKLWKLLIDKMGKNKAVSMEVLGKICIALDCNIGDIVDVIKED